jgi:hypothetical protein
MTLKPSLFFSVGACLLLSACAWRTPAPEPVVVVPVATQCAPVVAEGEGVNVPYEVLEARCGAEAWCAGWQQPALHNLIFAQTFRQCVARAMVGRPVVGSVPAASSTTVIVQPVPGAAMPVPPMRPRPYRN